MTDVAAPISLTERASERILLDPSGVQQFWSAAQTGNDPALRLLVDVWSELPDAVKNRILKVQKMPSRQFGSGFSVAAVRRQLASRFSDN